MEAIFLNYRRSDSEGQARALFQNLVDKFGRDAVLLDVAGLEKGRDFRKTIDRRLTICKVMLAVIGRSWLDARDEQGARRLDSSEDLVRIEIASALGRDIPVIPVLVGGASMPRAADLPKDLKDLAFRDGVELTHARWDSDVQLLIKALEPYLGDQPAKTIVAQRSTFTRVLLYVALACALVGGSVFVYRHEFNVPMRAAAERQKGEAEAEAKVRAAVAKQEELEKRPAAAAVEAPQRRTEQAKANEEKADKAATDAQGAAGTLASAPARSDSISEVKVTGYRNTGAEVAVTREVNDRAPARTAIRLCLLKSGRGIGVPCRLRPALPGTARVVMNLQFTDPSPMNLKGQGSATLEACLVAYSGEELRVHTILDGTCVREPW